MCVGNPNVRKVAALTYQALLSLASTQLGVPVASLTVTNGVVSGGGKTVSYGELVKAQQLNLTIPVAGSLQSLFGLIGDRQPADEAGQPVQGDRPVDPDADDPADRHRHGDLRRRRQAARHAARPCRASDRRSARTLVSVGTLDKKQFPNTQIVRQGQPRRASSTRGVQRDPGCGTARAHDQVDARGRACPSSGNLFSRDAQAGLGLRRPGHVRRQRRATPTRSVRHAPRRSSTATLRVPVREARADRTDLRGRRLPCRRNGLAAHAQPEPAARRAG